MCEADIRQEGLDWRMTTLVYSKSTELQNLYAPVFILHCRHLATVMPILKSLKTPKETWYQRNFRRQYYPPVCLTANQKSGTWHNSK